MTDRSSSIPSLDAITICDVAGIWCYAKSQGRIWSRASDRRPYSAFKSFSQAAERWHSTCRLAFRVRRLFQAYETADGSSLEHRAQLLVIAKNGAVELIEELRRAEQMSRYACSQVTDAAGHRCEWSVEAGPRWWTEHLKQRGADRILKFADWLPPVPEPSPKPPSAEGCSSVVDMSMSGIAARSEEAQQIEGTLSLSEIYRLEQVLIARQLCGKETARFLRRRLDWLKQSRGEPKLDTCRVEGPCWSLTCFLDIACSSQRHLRGTLLQHDVSLRPGKSAKASEYPDRLVIHDSGAGGGRVERVIDCIVFEEHDRLWARLLKTDQVVAVSTSKRDKCDTSVLLGPEVGEPQESVEAVCGINYVRLRARLLAEQRIPLPADLVPVETLSRASFTVPISMEEPTALLNLENFIPPPSQPPMDNPF